MELFPWRYDVSACGIAAGAAFVAIFSDVRVSDSVVDSAAAVETRESLPTSLSL